MRLVPTPAGYHLALGIRFDDPLLTGAKLHGFCFAKSCPSHYWCPTSPSARPMHQSIATPGVSAPPRKKRRARRTRYILIALLLLVAGGIATSVILAKREKPIPVLTEKAVRKTILQTVSATGKIQPEVE